MKVKPIILFAAMSAIVMGGCSGAKNAAVADGMTGSTSPTVSYLPNAIAYRTSIDVIDNVPVNLDSDRKSVASYPAPTDLASSSTPLKLANGWLLDRRGVGPTTAFTRWTYSEYRAMPTSPSCSDILENLVEGAYVTEIIRLPMKVGQATVATANAAIKSGDYEVVYTAPAR